MPRPEAIAIALSLALVPAVARGRDASVVLRWKPVDGAVEYELEICADPDVRRVVLRQRVPTTGYRWRDLPDERRWWRVRGVDARGRPGLWSEVKVLDPVLRAPEARRAADGAIVPGGAEAEIECAPSAVADAYELEIATDPGFASIVERLEGPDPLFRVALGAGAYRWRMRASLGGQRTPWSTPRRVSVAEVPVEVARAEAPAVPPTEGPAETPTPTETPTETQAPAPNATEPAVAPALAAEPATAPEPAPPAAVPAPPAPEAVAIAKAATGDGEPGRLRVGARLGWHTTFAGISVFSPGAEADWRLLERLSVSARLEYYGVSSTIPPLPGLAAPMRATAHVVPLGAALVWTRPLGTFSAYAGAGGQAQLVYTSLAGQSRLDLVPGAMLLAGGARSLGRGELFVEACWATGDLDGALARLHTGGFHVAAGFRGTP